MSIEQDYQHKIDVKLNQQNALKAALLLPLWSVLILLAWYVSFQIEDRFAPVFLTVSGIVVGLLVRLHGRGITRLFSGIAFIVHMLIVVAAFALGMGLAAGQSLLAAILLGLYCGGAWCAMYLARRNVPMLEQRALFQLTQMSVHSSQTKWQNRWFFVLPSVLLLTILLLSVSVVALHTVDQYRFIDNEMAQRESVSNQFESKAIDVTPTSLDEMSTEDALLHVYAYQTGWLPNKYGELIESYPRSSYKAKTILKYLIKKRNNSRAKFILGILEEGQNYPLIKDASEEGDEYAKLYLAVDYGCDSNADRATLMLQHLQKTVQEPLIKRDIQAVLFQGMQAYCQQPTTNELSIYHVITK